MQKKLQVLILQLHVFQIHRVGTVFLFQFFSYFLTIRIIKLICYFSHGLLVSLAETVIAIKVYEHATID